MTALPSTGEAGNILPNDNPHALDLYDTVVLPAERAASESEARAMDDDAASSASRRTVFARAVGYLLLYPPSNQARAVVQGEVERCSHEPHPNKAVCKLGEMYVKDLILPFYSISDEMTPQPYGLDSRDAYQLIKDRARHDRLNIPHDTAEAKNFAAARDDFRCIVSGVGDYFAMQNGIIDNPVEDRRPPGGPGRTYWTVAECCHIFPEALEVVREYSHCWPLNVAENHAEAFWAILGRFGYGHIHDELRGTKIHRLENVMTLAGSIHALFRGLDLWFEQDCDNEFGGTDKANPDGTPTNSYRVRTSPRVLPDRFDPPLPERVHFVASTSGLPLPDPTYLHVHAACCRVSHLSGASGHLKALFWEEVRRMEDDRLGRARAFLDAEARFDEHGHKGHAAANGSRPRREP